jgi:AraC-like DNA-binding protein
MFQALDELNMLAISPPVHKIDLDENMQLPERIWQLGWLLTYASDDQIPDAVAEMIDLFGKIKKLSYAMEPDKKYNKLIELACRELSQNFTKPFSLQNFCRRHAIGYENFRKLFRAHTGMAPWDYRIRCKMKNSVELLRNGELNLKEIAEQLGYRSPYEFSAQFKKKFGISPGAYRKKNR